MTIEFIRVAEPTSPAISGFIDWQSSSPFPLSVQIKEAFATSGEVSFAAFHEGSQNYVVFAFGQIFEWPEKPHASGHSPTVAGRLLTHFLKHETVPKGFSGEFSAVIIDKNSGTVTLITDHTATRPMYYVADNRGVAFSTDASSLLTYCKNPQDLDPQVVAYQLNGLHHLCPGRMMVREIMRAQPATVLKIKKSGTKQVEYWRPEDCLPIRYVREEDYYDHARELLKRVVIERTPRSSPFGSHLSGGLDSTVITAVACEHRKKIGVGPPTCYAWQPPVLSGEMPTPDQHILGLCEKFLSLQVKNITPDTNTVKKYIEFDPAVHEYASDLLLELEVMKTAQSNNITKILSGWGGDQAFSFSGRNPAASNPLRFYPHLFKKHFFTGDKPREPITVPAPRIGRFYGLRLDASRRTARQTQISNIRSQVLSRRMAGWSVVGTRYNLQYSYPLIDRRLLDFALGVPENLYYRAPHKRWLMRQTLKGLIPDEVRWHSDKSEPSRVGHSLQLIKEVEVMLTAELAAVDPKTNSRMAFIDPSILNKSGFVVSSDENSPRYNGRLQNISAFINSG